MTRLTANQRDYVRGLMRKLGLPDDVIAGIHQRAFVAAGWDACVFGYRIGQQMDAVLAEMDVEQGRALVNAMKAIQQERSR